MRVFIGYGYNARDAWVKENVFPILEAMHIRTMDGKDAYGLVLQQVVKDRIDQSDALIGFCTLRKGQEKADFNTHPWVRDEMMYALGAKKPVLEVRETGVKELLGLRGERQYIPLDPANKLACVSELVKAVAGWSMRRLLLIPTDVGRARRILQALTNRSLTVQYRARINGIASQPQLGRVERENNSLYLDVIGLPPLSFIEVEGTTAGGVMFNTGWVSADLVRVEI